MCTGCPHNILRKNCYYKACSRNRTFRMYYRQPRYNTHFRFGPSRHSKSDRPQSRSRYSNRIHWPPASHRNNVAEPVSALCRKFPPSRYKTCKASYRNGCRPSNPHTGIPYGRTGWRNRRRITLCGAKFDNIVKPMCTSRRRNILLLSCYRPRSYYNTRAWTCYKFEFRNTLGYRNRTPLPRNTYPRLGPYHRNTPCRL